MVMLSGQDVAGSMPSNDTSHRSLSSFKTYTMAPSSIYTASWNRVGQIEASAEHLISFLWMTGLQEKAGEMAERFAHHQQQCCLLNQKNQELEAQHQDLVEFVGGYEGQRLKAKAELEKLNERMAVEVDLTQTEIQSMAQHQQHLTSKLQILQSRWDTSAEKDQDFKNQRIALLEGELEILTQRFMQHLCGSPSRSVLIENEEDPPIELNLSSREWGNTHFPILHAFFKVYAR